MTLTQKIENLELQIENAHEEWLVAESYEEAFLARERMSLLNKNLEILKKELAKVSDSNLCEECGKMDKSIAANVFKNLIRKNKTHSLIISRFCGKLKVEVF